MGGRAQPVRRTASGGQLEVGACVIDMKRAALVRMAHGASGWQLTCTQEREHKVAQDASGAWQPWRWQASKLLKSKGPYPQGPRQV